MIVVFEGQFNADVFLRLHEFFRNYKYSKQRENPDSTFNSEKLVINLM